jgi:hypothetical protein
VQVHCRGRDTQGHYACQVKNLRNTKDGAITHFDKNSRAKVVFLASLGPGMNATIFLKVMWDSDIDMRGLYMNNLLLRRK